jgi:hypothetical protein
MQLKSLVVSGALGLATALMPVAASAQDAEGGAPGAGANASPRIATKCRVIIGDAHVATSNVDSNTASNLFSNITDTTVTFKIPGDRNRCVLVVFSAEPFTPGSELMHIRALRDGVVCNPSEQQFSSGDGTFRKVNTAQFQCLSVPPGKHTIQMQFRSQTNGVNVFLTKPVTSVFNE